MESEKHVGEVVWFCNKRNYGFIARENERDLFVHWSDISMEGYKTLKRGQKVAFSIGLNNKGKPKATEVAIIAEASD